MLLQAKFAAVALHPAAYPKAALETKLPGSGGHGTASEWNVPSWFKVQPPEPEGPRDHLRPPTHAPSILLPTSPLSSPSFRALFLLWPTFSA